MYQDVLAWVVYETPITPITGCGGWGVNVENAMTGQGIGTQGWEPGP
jgi:hypothetical protein